MSKPDNVILAAACRTKQIDPADVVEARMDGPDILLTLKDGSVVRVELLALPAEILSTEPQPEKAEQPKRKRSK
jgi:hypothetical protein